MSGFDGGKCSVKLTQHYNPQSYFGYWCLYQTHSLTLSNKHLIQTVKTQHNTSMSYYRLFWGWVFFFLAYFLPISVLGFGSFGPISAAFGNTGFFCAIDASGKQQIFCWDKSNSSSSSSDYFTSLPPMAGLTGGYGFMCGLISNTSQAYCWNITNSGKTNLVPQIYGSVSYAHVSAGKTHVCGFRGSYYTSLDNSNGVDCWDFTSFDSKKGSDFVSKWDLSNLTSYGFRKIVSGDGFSCGSVREGGVVCWGPNSMSLDVSGMKMVSFVTLASSRDSVCGIEEDTGWVKCWGNADSFRDTPGGTRFVELTAGAAHFCGIREDTHGVECWGDHDPLLVPKGEMFLAIASSDFIVCGVKEDGLVLDCWGTNGQGPTGYSAPVQLSSPGICMAGACRNGEFAFNASILGMEDLTHLCVNKDYKICSPCALNCSKGFFPSSVCSENADRVCTECSLCQNSSCWDVCRFKDRAESEKEQQRQMKRLAMIIGCSLLGLVLVLVGWCFLPRRFTTRKEEERKRQCTSCISKPDVEADVIVESELPLTTSSFVGVAQVFRLSELKDATNGFKEFNELGRGSYGFVYKAVLSDGQQVAVKRANAATIIHTNSRDFESELDILCNIRHGNIVNLLGYCAEMGERLLVYEFMPHGTLHDHLHGGLSPLKWTLRLKISLQAARGLEYLHKDVVPPIIHRDVKTSNILLDSDWGARVAEFGLLTSNREQDGDLQSDVFNFGVVLLEILSGRKAFDNEYTPPNIVEWAVPLIRKGKAAAIIDQNVALPRNVEPLFKLAEVAEHTLREDPSQRPTMSTVVTLLEQIVKMGLHL